MDPLSGTLDQILDWHASHGSPVASTIQPGLSEDEILTKTSRLPFKLPREFVELYRWRNGVPWDTQGETSFFEFYRFLPLDEALTGFQSSHPIMKEFYTLTDWVMTFQDASGDGYGISGGKEKTEAAPVTFLFEGEEVKVVFATLTRMMATMAACFDENVFFWSRGRLETNFNRFGQVAHRLNPDIQYWRDYIKGG